MPIKKIIILVIILAVLLALAALTYVKTQPPPPSQDAYRLYFPDFNDQMTGRIKLEKPSSDAEGKEKKTEKVEVAKVNNVWVVANRFNYPVQESQVTAVLDTLKNLKRGEVYSSRKDAHGEFEVTEDKALHLQVEHITGSMMADLYIGKRSGLRGSFARAAGSDDVRLLAINQFPTAMSSWLNTSCFDDFQADNVTGIAVNMPEFSYILLKDEIDKPDPKNASKTIKETVWNLVEPEEKEAKPGIGGNLAGLFAKLSIADVADDKVKPEYGFDNATMIVAASVVGRENDITVTFGALKETGEKPQAQKQYYMQISDVKYVFLAAERTFKQFNKKLDDLREKPKEKPKKPEKKPVKPGEEKKPAKPGEEKKPEKGTEKPGEKPEGPKAPDQKPGPPEKKPAEEQKKPSPPEEQPKKDDTGKKDSPETEKPEKKSGGIPPLPPQPPGAK